MLAAGRTGQAAPYSSGGGAGAGGGSASASGNFGGDGGGGGNFGGGFGGGGFATNAPTPGAPPAPTPIAPSSAVPTPVATHVAPSAPAAPAYGGAPVVYMGRNIQDMPVRDLIKHLKSFGAYLPLPSPPACRRSVSKTMTRFPGPLSCSDNTTLSPPSLLPPPLGYDGVEHMLKSELVEKLTEAVRTGGGDVAQPHSAARVGPAAAACSTRLRPFGKSASARQTARPS